MKKRQKEIEQKYEEQWDGGKGSHHPDYDPEAVRGQSGQGRGWRGWRSRGAECRASQMHAQKGDCCECCQGQARPVTVQSLWGTCPCAASAAICPLGVQHGDDVIKASRETEELYNAIVKVRSAPMAQHATPVCQRNPCLCGVRSVLDLPPHWTAHAAAALSWRMLAAHAPTSTAACLCCRTTSNWCTRRLRRERTSTLCLVSSTGGERRCGRIARRDGRHPTRHLPTLSQTFWPFCCAGRAYRCPEGYTPLMVACHRGRCVAVGGSVPPAWGRSLSCLRLAYEWCTCVLGRSHPLLCVCPPTHHSPIRPPSLAPSMCPARLECAKALLRAGADPNYINGAGDLTLFWAIDGGECQLGHVQTKGSLGRFMLTPGGLSCPAAPTCPHHPCSVYAAQLMVAHCCPPVPPPPAGVELIKLMHEYGADLDATTPKNWTPLSYCKVGWGGP